MSGLPPAKERFALLIAQGETQASAIRKIGKTPQTATAWMKDPEIKRRVQEFQQDITSEAVNLLRGAAIDNIEIILDIARNGGEPGQVNSRLKAAMWAAEKVIRPAGTAAANEAQETKALREVAAELEQSSDEELESLIERGLT